MRTGVAIFVIFTLLSACGGVRPTAEDEARKQQLATAFSNRYEFDFEDIYLRAKSKSGSPTAKDAAQIYSAFWLDGSKPRTTSNLVYLNLYDERSKFAFQASWDPKEQRIAFSRTEHY